MASDANRAMSSGHRLIADGSAIALVRKRDQVRLESVADVFLERQHAIAGVRLGDCCTPAILNPQPQVGEKGCLESVVYPAGDRWFESLYPSKRSLAGRHCRLAEPGRPTGSRLRILCFEHLKGTCAPAGRPRRKSRGRLRLERQYRD